MYRGPCHTYKVQRLSESTSYKFCIQACNEAGEGPLSQEYIFTTPKSVPAALKGKDAATLFVCLFVFEAVNVVGSMGSVERDGKLVVVVLHYSWSMWSAKQFSKCR